MLKCFTVAGLLGFVAIVLFAHRRARLSQRHLLCRIERSGGRGSVAWHHGVFRDGGHHDLDGGSTLDSTFTALGKLTARDLPGILGHEPSERARDRHRVHAPVRRHRQPSHDHGRRHHRGDDHPGTMIMGLGPVFLMHGVVKPTKIGFMLAFWIGMILGVWDTVAPATLAFMNVGTGSYANFLGVNLWGAIACWAAYIIPRTHRPGSRRKARHSLRLEGPLER